MEVFDAATGQWQVLAQNYQINAPPLGWVRGGFVGDKLWLFGGEQGLNAPLVSQVQAKDFGFAPAITGAHLAYLPFMSRVWETNGETLNTAVALTPGQPIQNSFTQAPDVFHSYLFDVDRERTVQLTLGNIPFGSNYDILLYNQNKGLLSAGQNLGANPEQELVRLGAGRYYLLVVRDSPPPAVPPDTTPYHLAVHFMD
jgi:hypothetical protein